MDYEKKYNEALKRAKKQIADYQKELDKTDKESQLAGLLHAGISALDMAFPELRESEDERIRREIIEYLRGDLDDITTDDTDRWITYLEKQKDASKAIEAVDRIDKYIDEHLANAHYMKDSNPDKKYYRGWDDALGKMSGILQDVYSGEKKKENADSFTNEQKVPDCCLKCNEYEIGYKAGYEHGCTAGYNKAMKEVDEQKENPKNAISIPADCATNAKCPYKIHGDEDFIGDIKDTPAYHFGFDEGVRSEREKQKEQNDIPLMNGDADLYFDNWIQHNDTTKRGFFEEGIRYAQRLQKEQKPSINIEQLKSLMLQYLQEAANKKDDSDIEADTDKWARKILGYDFEQKEQKPTESISHLTVQGKGVYKICPRCKERMVRDDSKVYTSMPPQYGYECPKCGEMEFDTVMYDNPEMEEKKSTEWSKNDTVFLKEIIDYFENKTVRLQHDLDMYAHWLKSLPERFNLQPKKSA